MESIFYKVLLNDRIKIEPRNLSKEYRAYVLDLLRRRMEGRCTRHGYIKEGSIDVYKVAPGSIELVGLNGSIVFDVHYYAEVCNPLIGNTIKATVTNMNKFGILAEVGGILEIVIAKNSINIQHDAGVDVDSIQIGHQVMVEVIGKKFELNDKKISIVGRLVSGVGGKKRVVQRDVRDPEDDEEEGVDMEGGDDNEEEGDDDEEGENEEGENEKKGGGKGDEEAEADAEEEGDVEADDGDGEEAYVYKAKGNEFFDSDDEDLVDEEYEFYSEEASGFGDGSDAEDEGDVF